MNLIEKLQEQMNRCRELLKAYEELGDVGTFGQMVIQESITEGETAIASGDVARMIQAHHDLSQRK